MTNAEIQALLDQALARLDDAAAFAAAAETAAANADSNVTAAHMRIQEARAALDPAPPPPPPALTVTQSLKDGDQITGPVDWTATPNNPVTEVDFYIDAALKQIDVTPPYSYRLDPADLADGQHTFTVRALDPTGKTATSDVTATTKKPVPPPPPPPPPAFNIPTYGVCPGAPSHEWTDAQHAKAMQLMQTLFGNKPWTWRVEGSAINSRTDRDVNNVIAAGGTPYLVLYSSQGPRAIDSLPTQIATRYKGKGIVVTGPNEPDLDRGTKVHWTPAPLAAFQKQIYDQVKAVDPSILVGSPAFWKTWLVPTEKDPWPLSRAKLQEFIAEICKLKSNTGGPIVDFWAFHGYDDPAVHATYNIWSWWFPDGKFPAGSTMSETAEANGVKVPYVMDEGGANLNAADRAGRYTRLFDQAKAGRVANSTAYSLYYPGGGGDGLNICNPDGSPLPPYTALKQWLAAL